jgi:hypothetical protein
MLRKSITSERYFSREELQVEYKVDLSHLIEIDIDFLNQWAEEAPLFNHDKNKALNYLYENCETGRNVIHG